VTEDRHEANEGGHRCRVDAIVDGVCIDCERPPAPVTEDRAHVWLAPGEAPNTSKWTCCAECGLVQRADGRPQKPCRGHVGVELRVSGLSQHELWGAQ
jgi:hypothetical protein